VELHSLRWYRWEPALSFVRFSAMFRCSDTPLHVRRCSVYRYSVSSSPLIAEGNWAVLRGRSWIFSIRMMNPKLLIRLPARFDGDAKSEIRERLANFLKILHSIYFRTLRENKKITKIVIEHVRENSLVASCFARYHDSRRRFASLA